MGIVDNDYSFFGYPATYTPYVNGVAGTPVVLTAILDEEFDRESSNFGSVRGEALISVRQAQVAARPGYRDTFVTVDGNNVSQTWYIVQDGVKEKRTMADFGAEWVCEVMRDEKAVPR